MRGYQIELDCVDLYLEVESSNEMRLFRRLIESVQGKAAQSKFRTQINSVSDGNAASQLFAKGFDELCDWLYNDRDY